MSLRAISIAGSSSTTRTVDRSWRRASSLMQKAHALIPIIPLPAAGRKKEPGRGVSQVESGELDSADRVPADRRPRLVSRGPRSTEGLAQWTSPQEKANTRKVYLASHARQAPFHGLDLALPGFTLRSARRPAISRPHAPAWSMSSWRREVSRRARFRGTHPHWCRKRSALTQ